MDFDSREHELGLNTGQFYPRQLRALKNAHWYNADLNYAGTGDIATYQPSKISRRLTPQEFYLFVPSTFVKEEDVNKPSTIETLAYTFGVMVVQSRVFTPIQEAGRPGFRPVDEIESTKIDAAQAIATMNAIRANV